MSVRNLGQLVALNDGNGQERSENGSTSVDHLFHAPLKPIFRKCSVRVQKLATFSEPERAEKSSKRATRGGKKARKLSKRTFLNVSGRRPRFTSRVSTGLKTRLVPHDYQATWKSGRAYRPLMADIQIHLQLAKQFVQKSTYDMGMFDHCMCPQSRKDIWVFLDRCHCCRSKT